MNADIATASSNDKQAQEHTMKQEKVRKLNFGIIGLFTKLPVWWLKQEAGERNISNPLQVPD